MARFNHAFDFVVQVVSNKEDASAVTPSQLRAALIERAQRLSDEELKEACGLYDTYEMDDQNG